MKPCKREIVDFDGIRTHFFPNLALYTCYNEELIAHHSENANRFTSYVFGAVEDSPTEQEILEILFPENANPEAISTGMDACLALGENFLSHYKSFNARLNRQNHSHDLLDAVQEFDEKKILAISRKSRLRKSADSKILTILVNILLSENQEEKFMEICELCSLDLDFDAFVLIKILQLENEENAEEVQIIRENVVDQILEQKPFLAHLLKNGPEKIDEITKLLSVPIIGSSSNQINQLITKICDSSEISDTAVEEHYHQNFKLMNILVRTMIVDRFDLTIDALEQIPVEIKNRMFPGIRIRVLQDTLHFLHQLFKVFLNESQKFDNLAPQSFAKAIKNVWVRHAIIGILDSLKFSLNKDVFNQLVPLIPGSQVSNDVISGKVENAISCAIWIVKTFGTEGSRDSIEKLPWFDSSVELTELINSIEIAVTSVEVEDQTVNFRKIPQKDWLDGNLQKALKTEPTSEKFGISNSLKIKDENQRNQIRGFKDNSKEPNAKVSARFGSKFQRVDSSTKRRLFGGVGVGEPRNCRGFL
ncbi:P granule abnormality protein 2 [Caenorhabditis elegans]|uniref:P granule abnormality protein 2 n=1 Tax=Caenorhabditis elegans TaxID=6239 RepID=PGL2_CAEEL|nr:P granule abnormality protein 2 [Caenorhabditis elegans]P34266.2 RecName: Full=P granule abnormality protein 2 [Caenorhabditis elegans]BAC87887.1 PGL-2 [Caenorhabditis elegans]CCD61729.1 P granule abnormality protein 2 [Caenorhabditis elegans]|eukprot:NP_498911.1 P granule abnormality protein 2 [Caenorhabditis elegans]